MKRGEDATPQAVTAWSLSRETHNTFETQRGRLEGDIARPYRLLQLCVHACLSVCLSFVCVCMCVRVQYIYIYITVEPHYSRRLVIRRHGLSDAASSPVGTARQCAR